MEQKANEIVAYEEQKNFPTHQLATALFEIDRKYQEQFAHFLNELHTINSEIEQLEKNIDLIKESIAKEEEELQKLSLSIEAELLHLERLNEKLINKVSVALEMKKIDSLSKSYEAIIQELNEDIRVLEIDILQKELQKENLQLKIMPSKQKITELQESINKLQVQKKYIESLGLQKTPLLTNYNSSAVVDVEAE